jgi:hypothetical protein
MFSIILELFEPKSRITNAEATVVQLMNIAASDKRVVIVCRALFLFLFWRSKKENIIRRVTIK